MTQAITTLLKFPYFHKERIFKILIATILLILAGYVFMLQKAIVNVVERQKVSQQATLVSADIGDLESKYFSLKNMLTLELAYTKGLKNAPVTAYISKKPRTAMAVYNEF